MKFFDVAVLGGGPAGSIAALVLARAGLSVALIDVPISSSNRKVGESLPGAARPLLRHLGLLSVVENQPAHTPSFGNGSVWGSDALHFTDFIQDVNGLGWHLDRARFDQDLRSKAQSSGVQLIAAKATDVQRKENRWTIEAGEKIQCRWIVDAGGRSAPVARKFGAKRLKDSSLMAVFTWLPSADRDTRTLIESAADGWWYTSALSDGTRILSFHTDAELAGPLMKAPELYLQRLKQTVHLRSRIGKNRVEELHCREACGVRLDRFSGDGWIATGDAALAFDPLSSQGIFNALYTGMKAAQAVQRVLNGEEMALNEYTSRLESIRTAYLSHQAYYYSLETRWPENSFWRKRQSAQAVAAHLK